MKSNLIKAILVIAFIILTVVFTVPGIKSSKASIDFVAIENKRNSKLEIQNLSEYENKIRNIGNSTKVVSPDILSSNDTSRLALSIRLLDTMKHYLYAAVLSERIADLQGSSYYYHKAARYFLLETEKEPNTLVLFTKARENLDKCLILNKENLDAKVDLAVCIYNINNLKKPENQMDLMKPALLLREVVKSDSNHIDGLYFLGKLAQESNQLEKAIGRFKKLVSLQPQNREFLLELGRMYRQTGNETEAIYWENKAREIQ